jgi:hypothetical protein
MPEPRTGRLSDPQHRTPRREIGSSGAAGVSRRARRDCPERPLEVNRMCPGDDVASVWFSGTGGPISRPSRFSRGTKACSTRPPPCPRG